jgi:hypothetical protein
MKNGVYFDILSDWLFQVHFGMCKNISSSNCIIAFCLLSTHKYELQALGLRQFQFN